MAMMFMIKVDKVIINRDAKEQKVVPEQIRGDLVVNVREWFKSNKDMMAVGIDGKISQVTLIDPLSQQERHLRIAEDPDKFSQRLMDAQRQSQRRPASK